MPPLTEAFAAALWLAGWLARGGRVDINMAMPADVGAELGLRILRVGADGLVPWARRCEAYSRQPTSAPLP